MICYRCGSVLGSGRHCLHCGANITVYRKIVRISNAYYNAALEQARVRNLTAAVASLERALEYDKKNTKARNLLGLIFYELGEITEALVHWVISKNYQPHDNPAEYYLSEIQGDRRLLESMNQAVRKYNQALDNARHDGVDLAIIQLRSVIGTSPNYLKAYQLLALLYIKEGELSKAGKLIKRGLAIDRGNVVLLGYSKETKGKIGHRTRKEALADMTRDLAGADVIVPQYTENSRVKQLLIGAGIGVAVLLAAYFFLIRPSIMRSSKNEISQNAISYYEKIEDKDARIELLTSQLDGIQEEVEYNRRQIELYTGENGSVTNYDRIITALNQIRNRQYSELLELYPSINADVITDESFVQAYEYVTGFVGSDTMLSGIMDGALERFAAYRYAECRDICQKCLDINPNYAQAIYYMALSYEAEGNDSAAAPYFREIVEKFPSSEYYELAKRRTS